jgi:invasion protein IalB
MNFRISAASAGRLGRVFALLAATAMTGALLASDAQAQTAAPAPAAPAAPAAPKKKAAPKAAPAPVAPAPAAQAAPPPPAGGGAPAAPGPAAGQGQEPPIELIYSPWTKFCLNRDPPAKKYCVIGKDGRIESGQIAIAAALLQQEGEKQRLRVTLPLGMVLAYGARMYIDSGQPAQTSFIVCLPNGCAADYELTPELLADMKKGQNLVVQAINASNGSALTLAVPLQEAGGSFAKAFDGPPTDPKQFEENQKKLQEELQKRAEEARKKLQDAGQQSAPASPAAK